MVNVDNIVDITYRLTRRRAGNLEPELIFLTFFTQTTYIPFSLTDLCDKPLQLPARLMVLNKLLLILLIH